MKVEKHISGYYSEDCVFKRRSRRSLIRGSNIYIASLVLIKIYIKINIPFIKILFHKGLRYTVENRKLLYDE